MQNSRYLYFYKLSDKSVLRYSDSCQLSLSLIIHMDDVTSTSIDLIIYFPDKNAWSSSSVSAVALVMAAYSI